MWRYLLKPFPYNSVAVLKFIEWHNLKLGFIIFWYLKKLETNFTWVLPNPIFHLWVYVCLWFWCAYFYVDPSFSNNSKFNHFLSVSVTRWEFFSQHVDKLIELNAIGNGKSIVFNGLGFQILPLKFTVEKSGGDS